MKACAYALGYPDPFTFSHQFRKSFGVAPSSLARPPAEGD